jgi:prepilin-type N-terminal cleavage/methylation domain-containing protein
MKQEAGFTLIEVVASLVIVGIMAVFASLFLVVGLEGYEFTRKAADAAMNAEVALNRISLELKTINGISAAPVTNSSLAYTSSDSALTGDRTIKFASGNLSINTGGVDDYILIKDVSNPLLSVSLADLDNDGSDEVAYITVGFSLSEIPAFQVRVYPREMIDYAW